MQLTGHRRLEVLQQMETLLQLHEGVSLKDRTPVLSVSTVSQRVRPRLFFCRLSLLAQFRESTLLFAFLRTGTSVGARHLQYFPILAAFHASLLNAVIMDHPSMLAASVLIVCVVMFRARQLEVLLLITTQGWAYALLGDYRLVFCLFICVWILQNVLQPLVSRRNETEKAQSYFSGALNCLNAFSLYFHISLIVIFCYGRYKSFVEKLSYGTRIRRVGNCFRCMFL